MNLLTLRILIAYALHLLATRTAQAMPNSVTAITWDDESGAVHDCTVVLMQTKP
jgi:hypothetical protein